jgi:archaellum biogenesis ATPase FlaH
MAEPEFSQTFGISKETLKCVVSDKHRNEIAKRVGGTWESLATFIGVTSGEVDDIKEKYVEPLDRRLAMMRRWHELWGSEATYLRLVEGLRQIGRRDLIELIDQNTQLWPSASGMKTLLKFQTSNFLRLFLESIKIKDKSTIASLIVIIIMILFVGAQVLIEQRSNYNNTDQQCLAKNITHRYHSKIVAFNHQKVRDCNSPESDLPTIHPLFVGRENDVHQVLLRVARAHVVNINGAPGFGKSTLAIHVGYEIVKNGTSVRYINIEDKMFSIVNHWKRSKGKAKHKFSSNDVHPVQTKSLIKPSRLLLPATSSDHEILRSKNRNLLDELQRWSEAMKCTNVLILDNCDDILIGEYRQEFLSLIETLIMKSHLKLHIIIVSRERLLYLDSFDCWTVGELNLLASIKLLDKIAPAIDNETLREVAELVEGCPLALKVIGQLLHIHGAKLIPKLKKELINILDKASIPKQRVRVIMDVAFERLGILKDCGYGLSLFPGSFDEQAGTAIVQKECLELYFKQSLLNEYSLAYNYRYKMHRLIKEYLREKISISENTTFIIKFRAYFESLLLTYAKSQKNDKSETEKYPLSLDLHNLDYLKELLLTDMHLSSKELAVLGLLDNIDLVQFGQLYRYYALYIENIHEVCPLLNNLKLCGQLYSTVVRHLYQKCKCETIWAYLQNFFVSPCMEYFQCRVVNYLHDLDSFGVVHLSQDESSYIDIILSSHCTCIYNEGYRYSIRTLLIVICRYMTMMLLFIGVLCIIVGFLFALFGSLLSLFSSPYYVTCYSTVIIVGIVFCILCACILNITPGLFYYEMVIINTHHQFIRIIEVLSKVFCHYAIIFIAIILNISFIITLISRSVYVVTTWQCIILLLLIASSSLPTYCCQFIPVCI